MKGLCFGPQCTSGVEVCVRDWALPEFSMTVVLGKHTSTCQVAVSMGQTVAGFSKGQALPRVEPGLLIWPLGTVRVGCGTEMGELTRGLSSHTGLELAVLCGQGRPRDHAYLCMQRNWRSSVSPPKCWDSRVFPAHLCLL